MDAQPSSERPVMGATRARQGRFGRPVFWVLLASTILAALALFAAWMWRAPGLAAVEPNNARESRDAQVFEAPQPPAPTPPSQ